MYVCMHIYFFFFWFFKTGFLSVTALAVLELTSLNLENCLPLPSGCWIKGVHHYHSANSYSFLFLFVVFLRQGFSR